MKKEFKKATTSYPNMGLNNKPCHNPVYWCPVHEIWLSETDAQKKGCFHKTSPDMMETRQCKSLQKKNYEELRKNTGRK